MPAFSFMARQGKPDLIIWILSPGVRREDPNDQAKEKHPQVLQLVLKESLGK